jgi:hypothetical protein
MATNNVKAGRPNRENEILLRLKVSEKGLVKAERIIRQARGYGLKVSH